MVEREDSRRVAFLMDSRDSRAKRLGIAVRKGGRQSRWGSVSTRVCGGEREGEGRRGREGGREEIEEEERNRSSPVASLTLLL